MFSYSIFFLIILLLAGCTGGSTEDFGEAEEVLATITQEQRAVSWDGRPTILLIGDSFTYGYGVRENETVAVNLEEQLIALGFDYQVVNLGVPGYNLLLIEKRLMHFLPKYPETRMVIYESHHYDHKPAAMGISDPNFKSPLKTTYTVLHNLGFIDPTENTKTKEWFVGRIEGQYDQWVNDPQIGPLLLPTTFEKPLYSIASELIGREIQFLIFRIPYQNKNGDRPQDNTFMSIITEVTESSPWVTYLPVSERVENGSTWEEHYEVYWRGVEHHHNPTGSTLLALEIIHWLNVTGNLDALQPSVP